MNSDFPNPLDDGSTPPITGSSAYVAGPRGTDSAGLQEPEGPNSNAVLTTLAWAVILGITGFLFFTVLYQQLRPSETSLEFSKSELMQITMMGKMTVGQAETLAGPRDQLIDQLEPLNTGTVEQRYCYAILLSELDSPERGLEEMDQIEDRVEEHGLELNESQLRMRDSIIPPFQRMDSQGCPRTQV